MRKWLALLALVLCVMTLFVGCGKKDETPTANPDPVTEDRAMTIAANHWGIHPGDRDPETGCAYSLMVVSHPSAEEPVYRVILRRTAEKDVDNGQYVTLDTVTINAENGKIITE